MVAYGHANHKGELGELGQEFLKKFNDDYYTFATYNGINLLAGAMAKAKSTNPVAVAKAMENLTVKSFAGEVQMRASDHQLQQPLIVSVMDRAGAPGVAHDVEGSGYGFRTLRRLEAPAVAQPSSCRMTRPE